MSSILRGSEPEYFLSYLRLISACYSRLDFMISTHASKLPSSRRTAVYCLEQVLCERDYSIPDLSSESPSLRAASICSSGFSPLQHPFAHSMLMVGRFLNVPKSIAEFGRGRRNSSKCLARGCKGGLAEEMRHVRREFI
jgi:hypothetical protein